MRPLRSFLLLLIFLACFTGLHYIIRSNQFFPSIGEFIPPDVISNFKSEKWNDAGKQIKLTDSIKIASADTLESFKPNRIVPEKPEGNPLQSFLDSLTYSRRQVRIIYYGDSQIEGDRITSYLRHTLRKGRGGTGPGLFLPLMPVMYTKSIWLRSSSNWKRYNYLSYKNGEISHRILGPFMAICRYLPEGETKASPEKAFLRICPSNVADSASADYDFLRIFYGNTLSTVKIAVKSNGIELFTDSLKTGTGINEIKCPLYRKRDIVI